MSELTPAPPLPSEQQRTGADRKEELKRSALSGLAWMSAGGAVRAVVKLGVLAALGRLLTPADFGLVAAAGVVVWLATIFSSLGIGPALVQRPEIEPRHVATSFAFSVGFGLLMGLLAAVLAPAIAGVFRLEGLTPIIRVLAIGFPVIGAAIVAENLLQRHLQFGTLAVCELASYIVGYGLVGVSLAAAGLGAWALVGAELMKTISKSALLLHATPHSKRLRFEGRAFAELFRFGSGYTIGTVSTYIASQADSFIVARYLGASALGFYSRAIDLMAAPALGLGNILDKILFPTMSKIQDERARLRFAYRRATALVAFTVLPVAAATIVLAPQVIETLLGPGWEGAVLPLRILAVAMYFRVSYMIGQSVAYSTGEAHGAAARTAVFGALVIVGAAIGTRWGLAGVATGVVAAIVAHFALVLHLGSRLTGLEWRDYIGLHGPALALSAAVAAISLAVVGVLDRLDASPPAVLAAAIPVIALAMLALLRTVPRAALGEDGTWLVQTLVDFAPHVVRPTLARVLLVRSR